MFRLDEFMEGFNAISLKLKEMYQVWESSLSVSLNCMSCLLLQYYLRTWEAKGLFSLHFHFLFSEILYRKKWK